MFSVPASTALSPVTGLGSQQISGKDALRPGSPAAVAEVPLRETGDAPLPELLHPRPETKIEHMREVEMGTQLLLDPEFFKHLPKDFSLLLRFPQLEEEPKNLTLG